MTKRRKKRPTDHGDLKVTRVEPWMTDPRGGRPRVIEGAQAPDGWDAAKAAHPASLARAQDRLGFSKNAWHASDGRRKQAKTAEHARPKFRSNRRGRGGKGI